MITLGDASQLNSAVYLGSGAALPEGWKEQEFIDDRKAGVTMGHYVNGDQNYLAIRGTWGPSDILPALRVFFGSDPTDRIEYVQQHIIKRFGESPGPQDLAVGGHSLGGLVAAAAAERFNLPGLAQNSPGWMTRVPDATRLNRFVQVRTARDVVADWGTKYPRNLMLSDPDLPTWGITSLHNLEHQNKLIEDHGLGHYRVDDPTLAPFEAVINQSPPTQMARFSRAIDKWKMGRDHTQLHGHLAGGPIETKPLNSSWSP